MRIVTHAIGVRLSKPEQVSLFFYPSIESLIIFME